jgi:hypothetical protein
MNEDEMIELTMERVIPEKKEELSKVPIIIGEWSEGEYYKNDVVILKNGNKYICIADFSTNKKPPSNDWEIYEE